MLTILDIKKLISDHTVLLGYPHEDIMFTVDCIDDEIDGKSETYIHIPTKFITEPDEHVEKRIRKVFGTYEIDYIEPCSTYLGFWQVFLNDDNK